MTCGIPGKGILIEGLWVHQEDDIGWCQCSENGDASGPGCGRYFTGLAAFHDHFSREGSGINWRLTCRTDAELMEVGLVRDRRGWWGVPE